MTIVLIADGAPADGLGHLARCSAIAVALRARGLAVAAFAYGATAPRVVDGIAWEPYSGFAEARAILLDTYTMPPPEQAALAARAPLAVVHDIGDVPTGTALVLASGDLRHAPLRAPFWGLPQRDPGARVERVLVTTGGGSLAPAAAGLAAAVKARLPEADVALVRGPYTRLEPPPGVTLIDAPPSLLDALLAADLVVSAAGQTALEAVATGAPTIALPMVDNQRRNAEALAAAGAAVIAVPDAVPALAAELAADHARRLALTRAGQAAVDGYGALRIAFRIAAL